MKAKKSNIHISGSFLSNTMKRILTTSGNNIMTLYDLRLTSNEERL